MSEEENNPLDKEPPSIEFNVLKKKVGDTEFFMNTKIQTFGKENDDMEDDKLNIKIGITKNF
jgi:hypothetical protein